MLLLVCAETDWLLHEICSVCGCETPELGSQLGLLSVHVLVNVPRQVFWSVVASQSLKVHSGTPGIAGKKLMGVSVQ